MISPKLPGTTNQQDVCLTFWYAAFGSGSSTILTVIQQDAPFDEDGDPGEAVSVRRYTYSTFLDESICFDW